MEKQKTALCLAIEYIESKEYNYLDGKLLNFANDIKNYLESLKPTEREMFEEAYQNGVEDNKRYFDNLTQD